VEGYRIRDESLAPAGRLKVEWAEAHMPVLMKIRDEFSRRRPLDGVKVAACLHVTKETAVLVKTLMAGGAEVFLSACNPLSTQDDVAAALVEAGVYVYAWRGMSIEEYYWAISETLAARPNLTMDDGGDLTVLVHKLYYGQGGLDADIALRTLGGAALVAKEVVGGTEETTTGVNRLKALAREGRLLYPVIAVNESRTKYMFDNRYGTGQSSLDGLLRATNILVAGKTVVVAGYGWVGRGIAQRARGLGARVIVVEVDPIRALEAYYDGFYVTSMDEAARQGDVFITATGDRDVIRGEHVKRMKNGAILANAGHFNVEISLRDLEEMAVEKRRIRDNVDEYRLADGKRVYLVGEGRLVNLAAAEGHPPEVMDMSFSNQALAAELIVKGGRRLKPRVYTLPSRLDRRIARLKLSALGVKLEKLTPEQRKYLKSWEMGT